MSEKIKVGILGATGMVGQRFVTLLENHPWFELVTLAASAHSAGKTYEEAIGGRWKMETPMPEFVKNMVVKNVADVEDVVKDVDFVFSAVNMPKDEIRAIEEEYAKTETPVVSNNSAHRWTPDVPMVVPEINPEHYEVIEHQPQAPWHQARLHRRQTELLHPGLHSGARRLEGIRAARGGCEHLPGDFRRGQDLQGLARDGGQHHPVHLR